MYTNLAQKHKTQTQKLEKKMKINENKQIKYTYHDARFDPTTFLYATDNKFLSSTSKSLLAAAFTSTNCLTNLHTIKKCKKQNTKMLCARN